MRGVQDNWCRPALTLVSFEDLFDGPFDYNDLSFSFTNTESTTSDVPEPATYMLMLGGLAAGWLARRPQDLKPGSFSADRPGKRARSAHSGQIEISLQ